MLPLVLNCSHGHILFLLWILNQIKTDGQTEETHTWERKSWKFPASANILLNTVDKCNFPEKNQVLQTFLNLPSTCNVFHFPWLPTLKFQCCFMAEREEGNFAPGYVQYNYLVIFLPSFLSLIASPSRSPIGHNHILYSLLVGIQQFGASPLYDAILNFELILLPQPLHLQFHSLIKIAFASL